MKTKVKVFQFRKDRRLRRITVGEKTIEVGDLKYIVVDGISIEIKPEYVLLTTGTKITPLVLLDEDYNLINPNRLLPPITFP